MRTVLITTSSFGMDDTGPAVPLVRAGFTVCENPFRRTLTESEVFSLLQQHRPLGLIAGVEPLTAAVLKAAGDYLKVISRCGSGLENVDLRAAEKSGITVYNTPEAPAQAVAELTVALMLSVLRQIPRSDRAMREGVWQKRAGALLGELTVGIVGLGRVGKRVAMLIQGFGATVIASDPQADSTWGALHHVDILPLAVLIQRADLISLHATPGPERSRPLFATEEFRRMKPGSYLINTARGTLVEEEALVEALQSGHLAGAAVDTFDGEPYRGPLCQLEQIVVTPHIGSYTTTTRRRMEEEAVEHLLHGLAQQSVLGTAHGLR